MLLDEVGGDFYDYSLLKDGKIGIIMMDVSGHGVPSAFISAMAKLIFTREAPFCDKPSVLLERLNRDLFGKIAENFLMVFYAILDPQQGTLEFSSAGHSPAILFSHKDNSITRLDVDGMLIGVLEEETYQDRLVELTENDRVFFYSDGILQSRNDDGGGSYGETFFGEERLNKFIADNHDLESRIFSEKLIETLSQFCGSDTFNDDITFLILDR